MNLLFDQNISFRLVKQIIDLFPDSKQVRELGLENSTDIEIFDFAKKNDLIKMFLSEDYGCLEIIE